jgi:hypothetical protein
VADVIYYGDAEEISPASGLVIGSVGGVPDALLLFLTQGTDAGNIVSFLHTVSDTSGRATETRGGVPVFYTDNFDEAIRYGCVIGGQASHDAEFSSDVAFLDPIPSDERMSVLVCVRSASGGTLDVSVSSATALDFVHATERGTFAQITARGLFVCEIDGPITDPYWVVDASIGGGGTFEVLIALAVTGRILWKGDSVIVQRTAPGTPVVVSPADASTVDTLAPVLAWRSLFATTYDVYFGTSNPPSLVASGQSTASYPVSALDASSSYFWKLVAHNELGTTTGPVFSFETTASVEDSVTVLTTTSTGNQDDFNPGTLGTLNVLRCNNASLLTIRGLANGVDGQMIWIESVGAGQVAIADQDTNSTAANRVITNVSGTTTLTAGAGRAQLCYDGTTARWRVLSAERIVSVQTTTSTGTQNDFALNAGAQVLRCNNASLLTLNGLGAGVDGQRVEIVSIGAGQVDIANQAAGSTAANRVINNVTATISLAGGSGRALVIYDGTTARWRVVEHEQGAWINVPYSSGNFTSDTGSWTVASGDVTTFKYRLSGRTLTVDIELFATTVGGTPQYLRVAIPGGFTLSGDEYSAAGWCVDNGTPKPARLVSDVGVSGVSFDLNNGSFWATSTDNTHLGGQISIEVQ